MPTSLSSLSKGTACVAILHAVGATAELEELYAHASKPGEFASFELPEGIVTYLDLERAARVVRTSHSLVIPGMLQVEPYVRRLFQLARVDANVIEQRVRARLKRQERLRPSNETPDPVQLIAVIVQEALLRCAQEPSSTKRRGACRFIGVRRRVIAPST